MEGKRVIEIPITGIKGYVKEKALIIQSEECLYALNSSILGGGFTNPHNIINLQVDKGYDGNNPTEDLVHFSEKAGLNASDTVGMMTAALVDDLFLEYEQDGDLTVVALVTAGISNALAAGGKSTFSYSPRLGTINIVVLIDGNLSPGAMVNAVITATEAKTLALMDLKVKDVFSGEPASGTSTDAVIIAATGREELLPYAGTATRVGQMIGRTVRKAVSQATNTYLKRKLGK
ncbi:MAG: adenosylcobinamide amidohydrolase [Desulfitobacteriaceae bacterium]|nr:adenosylcobinamide amidohydrolase [Desulfitobacteriaceae bacterium]MDD4751639.1 adenosylcobinamide amidohydrolase [Desulfitobacteriaceae bacterium]